MEKLEAQPGRGGSVSVDIRVRILRLDNSFLGSVTSDCWKWWPLALTWYTDVERNYGLKISVSKGPTVSFMQSAHVTFISHNAAKAGGTLEGMACILDAVKHSEKDWDVLFLSEADAHKQPDFELPVQYECHRHLPQNSWAMAFIFSPRASKCVQFVRWSERVGGVWLRDHTSDTMARCSYFFVGVHGTHSSDTYEEFLQDLAAIISLKPRGAKLVASGDWNCDLLLRDRSFTLWSVHDASSGGRRCMFWKLFCMGTISII